MWKAQEVFSRAMRDGSAIGLYSIGTEVFPAIGRKGEFGSTHRDPLICSASFWKLVVLAYMNDVRSHPVFSLLLVVETATNEIEDD